MKWEVSEPIGMESDPWKPCIPGSISSIARKNMHGWSKMMTISPSFLSKGIYLGSFPNIVTCDASE
jgi:hypothetical protein